MSKKTNTILIKNPAYVITLDSKKPVLKQASIFIEDNKISEINSQRRKANKIIDASGMVIFPGFINTHLHSPQVFHRHSPAQQNKPIAQWIQITTSISQEIDEEAAYYGALVCFVELMLSGATTVLDYFYPFVQGKPNTIEATLQAAKDIGVRFTSIRGSMSQSKKQGTLYSQEVVEDLDQILSHSQTIIDKFHDPSPLSMTRIGLGPCVPFSSGESDYTATAQLARKHPGVILQTHAAESNWEVQYCQTKFGTTPIRLMEQTGFLGPDASLVHCNTITQEEIKLLGASNTNIVITPIGNTRDAADGNGIAPIHQLLAAGSNVSIGVDGPASNDSMNLQDEMRYLRTVSQAKIGLYWHRNQDQSNFSYLNPLDVLILTNLGGAQTLNRNDIGSIAEGQAADVAIFDPDQEISHAGAVNKWASILSCQPLRPRYLLINGQVVIKNGQLTKVNIKKLNSKFRQLHSAIIKRTQKKIGRNITDY